MKASRLLLLLALLLAATTTFAQSSSIQDPIPACMYCKHQGQNSGWLVSFSYCADTEECLQDEWNYLNRKCASQGGWKKGASLSLQGNCSAVESTEGQLQFTSSSSYAGNWNNRTYTLREGEFVNVLVDARDFVGRVVFDDQPDLGFNSKNHFLGKVISFTSGTGEDNSFIVYNAAAEGDITFLYGFSSAFSLLAMASSALVLLMAQGL